jgi:F0F1-type ATP synthase membrane subunit b/b'
MLRLEEVEKSSSQWLLLKSKYELELEETRAQSSQGIRKFV